MITAATAAPFDWPDIEERDAAVLCDTTATTGDPKGVAYSHRPIYLHTMAISAGFQGAPARGANGAGRSV